MRSIEQRRIDFNDAQNNSYDCYYQCSEDKKFCVVNGYQWAGSSISKQFKNKPKPEFNELFRAVNRVVGQAQRLELQAIISSNSDDATDEDAELLNGLWRNDFAMADGIEAQNTADFEAMSGGFGAFKLTTKYEDEENPDQEKQYQCFKPISDACNSVRFNAGAIRKDKADAFQCWEVFKANRKLTEERFGVTISSFDTPTENSFYGNYIDSTLDVYLCHYWELIEKNITVYTFPFRNGDLSITTGNGKASDQHGQKYTRDNVKELKVTFQGVYTQVSKKIKYIEYVLMSGDQDLTKVQKQPFKRIPVFPRYGYHYVIDGQEYFFGEVAKQRDPATLQNLVASSIEQILAADQVSKPEYTPAQIAKHAQTRAKAAVENYPFVMSDVDNTNPNAPIVGPIAMHQPPQIGTGLATSMQYISEKGAIIGGVGQSTIPSNTSGEAVQKVNERQDDTYQPLFQNKEQSLRAACLCWIDGAQEIYFTNPRRLRSQAVDGSYSQINTMEVGENQQGQIGYHKNSAKGKYTVSMKAGMSHKSQIEQENMEFREIVAITGTETEMGQLAMLGLLKTTTGQAGEGIRKLARHEEIQMLVAKGIDPNVKTDEEKQFVQQLMQQMQQAQQQPPQPDPMMISAMAQQEAAAAEMAKVQQKAAEADQDHQKDMYGLALQEQKNQIEAQKAGAEIDYKNSQTLKNISDASKATIANFALTQ